MNHHDDLKLLDDSPLRYRTLFDLSPVAVYTCDSTGVVGEYNQRAAELWGRKPQPGDTDERFCARSSYTAPMAVICLTNNVQWATY
jgi:PAS domain-containing protein